MKKKKNGNQKAIVELRNGKKIEVNRYEQIELPDGEKAWLTKVSPFNKLLQHRFVPRKDIGYKIKIPELPAEAHQNWPKWFFMFVDNEKSNPSESKDRELDIYYVDWDWGVGCNERYVVKQLKDIDIKIFGTGERFIPALGPRFYKSEIFISDDYNTALPIETNYRRCPFCSSQTCITQGHTFIPTFSEKSLSKYEKRYLLDYNFCKKYKKSFISILQSKNLKDKKEMVCKFCGSSLLRQKELKEIKKGEEKYFKVLEIDNNTVNRSDPMETIIGMKKNGVFHNVFLEDIDMSDTLYECKQCFSVSNKAGTILLRSIDSFLKLNW